MTINIDGESEFAIIIKAASDHQQKLIRVKYQAIRILFFD